MLVEKRSVCDLLGSLLLSASRGVRELGSENVVTYSGGFCVSCGGQRQVVSSAIIRINVSVIVYVVITKERDT